MKSIVIERLKALFIFSHLDYPNLVSAFTLFASRLPESRIRFYSFRISFTRISLPLFYLSDFLSRASRSCAAKCASFP